MALSPFALHVNASTNRHSISPTFDHLKKSISPALKPIWKELQQQLQLKKIDVSNTAKKASGIVLDVLVDGLYRFVDQPSLPSQVYMIDRKYFEGVLVAKIASPQRVRYGFNGTFVPKPTQKSVLKDITIKFQ